MRCGLILLFAVAGSSIYAGDSLNLQPQTNEAINRGLQFLAQDAVAWRDEHHCVSCHHAAHVIWAMHESKRHGFTVDEVVLTELTKWVAESGDGRTSIPRPPKIPRALNTKAVYFALGLQAVPNPNVANQTALKQMRDTIIQDQTENGAWASWPETRPPYFGNSDESMTTLATLALLQAEEPGDVILKTTREKAIQWLSTTKTDEDPQSIAMRLVLWTRLERPTSEWQPLVERIKARQNSDGGWSQSIDMGSDAWATGQALYALGHAGIRPSDATPIYRGQHFLIANQRKDGSWPMTSRAAKSGDTGAKSLIPIIGGGSAWAILGLIKTQRSVSPEK